MTKKILSAAFAALLTITSINMAGAESSKPATVAILDTALNSNLSVFKDKIVHEVCILEWSSCANGSNFMEGPGAASMPLNQMSRNGFDHGTKMTHASVLTNPNIKVVFVRIVGATSTGTRQIMNEDTFVKAFEWVLANKDRFNITAVAMSQGHFNLVPSTNYCPSTPKTITAITNLQNVDVPVFLSAGNNKDLNRVTWPACITNAVTVSANSVTDGPAIYTNYDKNATDMFALGRLRVINSDGFFFNEDGTSISNQVAASIYVGLKSKNPTFTRTQILDIMKQRSYPLASKSITAFIVNKEMLNG